MCLFRSQFYTSTRTSIQLSDSSTPRGFDGNGYPQLLSFEKSPPQQVLPNHVLGTVRFLRGSSEASTYDQPIFSQVHLKLKGKEKVKIWQILVSFRYLTSNHEDYQSPRRRIQISRKNVTWAYQTLLTQILELNNTSSGDARATIRIDPQVRPFCVTSVL